MILNLFEKTSHWEELEKRLKQLAEKEVSVGVYSQKMHPLTTFTYSALFNYLSQGNPKMNLPPRPVLLQTFTFFKPDASVKKLFQEYFKDIHKKKSSSAAEKVLHGLGKFYRDTAAEKVMGSTVYLAENAEWTIRNKGFNAPMIETGNLRKKIAYKIDANIWEYGK